MGRWADTLVAELDGLKRWPLPPPEQVDHGIALRDGDKDAIREMLDWTTPEKAAQRLIVDPMPSRISSSFSSLIFGREPKFVAENEADQDSLDDLVDENNFRSELSRAARTASSEGEVWWRIYVDRDVADVPILQWYSRTAVYPLWRGSRLMAVAFVSRLADQDGYEWRHFEIHERVFGEDEDRRGGRVENVLYRRTKSTTDDASGTTGGYRGVGERVALASHDETALLDEAWDHGLDGMLAGRVANQIGTDPTQGISDYHDIEDWLLELTESASIGHINMKLTARKRALVPGSSVVDGTFDDGETLYVTEQVNQDLSGKGESKPPFAILEYSFDAEALIAYRRDAAMTALSRIGIDAQFAGIDPASGRAESGTALRIRLIPSQAAAEDRAQEWDNELPNAVRMLQQVHALSAEQRGFGATWSSPEEAPTMDRGSTLPEDPVEVTERVVTAVEGKVMARKTAVQALHEDWDQETVDAEVEAIEEESAKADPLASLGRTPGGLPGQENGNGNGGNGQVSVEALSRLGLSDGPPPDEQP